MLERDSSRSALALASIALMAWVASCSGGRFQSDNGAGGASGMGSGGKSSGGTSSGSGGASSGGASSGGATSTGGTLGVSGGSSVGGSAGDPSAGGVPPGGGPSGGVGNEGGTVAGSAGFGVAGDIGVGGSMTVSCANMPGTECVNCCRETIGNGAFLEVAYECSCSAACYDVCLSFCDGGTAPSFNCEFCIASEFESAMTPLCVSDRMDCDSNMQCSKYFECVNDCQL